MSTSTNRSPSPSPPALRGTPLRIERAALDALVAALRSRGFRVVAPVVRDGHLEHAEITSAAALVPGWRDVQEPGRYRLERDPGDPAVFGHNVGPQSWKPEFFPPRLRLLRMARDGGGEWAVDESAADRVPAQPVALFGARACDVAAIAVQDRVLAEGAHPDAHYVARREGAFIVSVDCSRAGGTCFCVSAGTGPAAREGYDLALTEVTDGSDHFFVVRAGSDRGADVMTDVPHREATGEEIAAAERVVAHTAASMGRSMDFAAARTTLQQSLDSPHWDAVAQRCLSCSNCTMVCPTCFCSSVEDSSDLSGEMAERTRVWDSCFGLDHSYIHGGSVRATTRARYRQWITHKLDTWVEQFGTSGCVGCGRCITWCPVGIDITAEVAALQEAKA